MTQETTQTVKEPKKKRSAAELKAHLAAKIKALDDRQELRDRKLLKNLAELAQEMAKRRPQQPTIGQAATLLHQAAEAIKLPQ